MTPLSLAGSLARLGRVLRADAVGWLGIGLASSVVALASVALSFLAAPLSRALVAPSGEALPLVLALGAVALLRGGASHLRARRLTAVAERAGARLRLALHEALLGASAEALDAHPPAELGARLAYEADSVRGLLLGGVAGALHNAPVVLGLAAVLAWADPWLALAALFAAPLVGLVVAVLARASRQAAVEAAEADVALARAGAESAALLLEARVYRAEDTLRARYDVQVRRAERLGRRAGWLAARMGPITQLVGAAVGALLLGLALTHPGPRQVTALAALALLYGPARSLATTAHALITGLASLDRVEALLGLPRTKPRQIGGDTLRLEAVSFAFAEGAPEVLRGVSLELCVGQLVVLEGANGAGKSTLLRVLAGLLEPTRGLAELAPAAWVPASPGLLEASLLDNVALGDASPDRARAMAALESAGAGEWAAQRGLDAPVEGLSTGQRQRVALARALYFDAPFLLLDEPTAALDAASAEALVRTLCALAERRGVVVASHREPLRDRADRVLTLREGALVDVPQLRRAARSAS